MREGRDVRAIVEAGGQLARLAFPASLALLAALAVGCGYQFRVEGAGPTIGGSQAAEISGPPPRIIIRPLLNASFEPNLETRYTNYVRDEFSSGSGAQVVGDLEGADLVLSGSILAVLVPSLSFTQTATLESRVEVVVAVKVEDALTKKPVWSHTAKGISEFFITSDLQFNRVLQNRALEQAGRFVAEDLASRFLLELESGKLTKKAAAVPTADQSKKP